MTKDEQIKKQQEEIQQLNKHIEEQNVIIANLTETLEEFKRQFFGITSEKTKKKEVTDADTADNKDSQSVTVKEHKRDRKPKSKREDIYASLPVRKVLIPLTDEERNCPYCNTLLEHMTYKEVREEIQIIPAKVERVKYFKEVAICPECKKDGDGTIVEAQAPKALMPHSAASASSVAYIMFQKVYMYLPYYRQESVMEQLGLKLSRETMSNWCIYCALNYMQPLYDMLHELMLKRDIIHADETVCQVLKEEGKTAESKSYMWIYTTGSDGLPSIVMYEYQPGRAGNYAKNFLEGFSGLLQCDGYTGYNKVEDVTLVCCLAHLRRKFYEALPASYKKKIKLLDINSEQEIKKPILPDEESIKKMIPAEVGLVYCNCLFFIERQLKGMPSEERKEKRIELETPIWDAFWKWISTVNPLGGSKLAGAITYAQNHTDTLCNYMLDGRCEISNNICERKAKTYAITRKNSLFHTSVDGAKASAIMHSIVETAKANNLNVFQYIYTLLLYMPDYKNEPAGIEMLLPWSDFIKEHCTGIINEDENITIENKIPLAI